MVDSCAWLTIPGIFCLHFSTVEGSIDALFIFFLRSMAETDTEFSKNKACPVVADTDNKLVSVWIWHCECHWCDVSYPLPSVFCFMLMNTAFEFIMIVMIPPHTLCWVRKGLLGSNDFVSVSFWPQWNVSCLLKFFFCGIIYVSAQLWGQFILSADWQN